MATLQKSRIGLAGGRRIGIEEMAKSDKARKELEELLIMMEAMEREDATPTSENDPDVPKEAKQAAAA